MERRMSQWFFALSLVVLALMLVAVWHAGAPSWKKYQVQYYRLASQAEPNAAAKNAVLATPLAVKQALLPGLQRVDRCTTCHLGVEDPTMKNAPLPFTFHPNLAPHRSARFGCTICHQGANADKRFTTITASACQTCHLPGTYSLPLSKGVQATTITRDGSVVSPILPNRAICTSCHGDAATSQLRASLPQECSA